MDLPLILMSVGIIVVIISFFIGNSQKKNEKEIEELSLSFYQENSQLKKRLKLIEEELLLSSKPVTQKTKKSNANSSINLILVNQAIALHNQGFNLNEIMQRTSLSQDQVKSILQNGALNP